MIRLWVLLNIWKLDFFLFIIIKITIWKNYKFVGLLVIYTLMLCRSVSFDCLNCWDLSPDLELERPADGGKSNNKLKKVLYRALYGLEMHIKAKPPFLIDLLSKNVEHKTRTEWKKLNGWKENPFVKFICKVYMLFRAWFKWRLQENTFFWVFGLIIDFTFTNPKAKRCFF